MGDDGVVLVMFDDGKSEWVFEDQLETQVIMDTYFFYKSPENCGNLIEGI